MDHLDFRGSVFNTPVIGKQVTQVTQTVTTVARPDDKMYVVLRTNFYYDGESTHVLGVAMSKDAANDFVRTYKIPDSRTTTHERGSDDLFYRHFEVLVGDIDDVAVYIEVANVI